MTSARRGGGGFKICLILRTNSTDRLREMRTRGRVGVKNLQNFVDVICIWPLRSKLETDHRDRDLCSSEPGSQ